MSRRERQLLEELVQAEVSRRHPELWTLARELHRRDWSRPQALRRALRDVSAFLRSSGFTLRTVAPHISDGLAGVATGRAPGPGVLLAAPFAHGAVAVAMTVGAASALASLRLRWPGEVTILVLPPRWQAAALNHEALSLSEQLAALGVTVGRGDGLAAPATYRARASIVFSQQETVSGGKGDALHVAVQAYQQATEQAGSLPDSQRLRAELHTRQTSRRGVQLAELQLELEALDEDGLTELVAVAEQLGQRWQGVVSVAHTARAGAAPTVTAPPVLWRKLGRIPAGSGGWDVVPHDLTELGLYIPFGAAVVGIGSAPGEAGFAQAVWGGQGERALRDGATLLAWHAAHLLLDGVLGDSKAEVAATADGPAPAPADGAAAALAEAAAPAPAEAGRQSPGHDIAVTEGTD